MEEKNGKLRGKKWENEKPKWEKKKRKSGKKNNKWEKKKKKEKTRKPEKKRKKQRGKKQGVIAQAKQPGLLLLLLPVGYVLEVCPKRNVG